MIETVDITQEQRLLEVERILQVASIEVLGQRATALLLEIAERNLTILLGSSVINLEEQTFDGQGMDRVEYLARSFDKTGSVPQPQKPKPDALDRIRKTQAEFAEDEAEIQVLRDSTVSEEVKAEVFSKRHARLAAQRAKKAQLVQDRIDAMEAGAEDDGLDFDEWFEREFGSLDEEIPPLREVVIPYHTRIPPKPSPKKKHVRASKRPSEAERKELLYTLLGEFGEWHEMGRCKKENADLFFPTRGASTRAAKAMCKDCDVRSECLEFALAIGEKFGIWGGMSERERRRVKREREIAQKAISAS